MFAAQFSHFGLSSNSDVRSSLPIPMIYENIPAQPIRWEYHVLSVDTAEYNLPDPERLNALGRDGWIMVGVLDERSHGDGTKVHYYFARSTQDEK